jgi:hypothetical protein
MDRYRKNYLRKLNDKGINFLEQEEYAAAIESFTEGLEFVRKLFTMQPESSESLIESAVLAIPVTGSKTSDMTGLDLGITENKFLYTLPIRVQPTEYYLFSISL